jgi:hypothetical protein
VDDDTFILRSVEIFIDIVRHLLIQYIISEWAGIAPQNIVNQVYEGDG